MSDQIYKHSYLIRKGLFVTGKTIEEQQWSSSPAARAVGDRRSGIDRRQVNARSITVPDMRSGKDRRSGNERRQKVRLTITGRAIDI